MAKDVLLNDGVQVMTFRTVDVRASLDERRLRLRVSLDELKNAFLPIRQARADT